MTDDPQVIVCAGPPICPFEDDEAVKNAQDGCPNCRRITIRFDGAETESRREPH
jgi:hypothetical protein